MSRSIIFAPEAEFELQEAFDWYEGELPGLGERFISLVENSLQLIAQRPTAFPAKHNALREKVLKGFPYLVVYEISDVDDIIYVLHVFHTSRDPRNKYVE